MSGLLLLHSTLAALAFVPAHLVFDCLQDTDKALHHILFLRPLSRTEKPSHVLLQVFVLEVEGIIGVEEVVDGISVAAEDDGI